MQIVSPTINTDSAFKKQIIQMKWGVPYGTPIPELSRRLASKMKNVGAWPIKVNAFRIDTPKAKSTISLTKLQKDIAMKMNVKTSTVNDVLSKYWRNSFVYPVS